MPSKNSQSTVLRRYVTAIRSHCYGIAATLVPSLNNINITYSGTGGSVSARYCYSVWLRHLTIAHSNGFDCRPQCVAELGPGDSLGIGICALIFGAERYVALDVHEYSSDTKNIQLFREIRQLVKARAPIPGEEELPRVEPRLECYDFPSYIFPEKFLDSCLRDSRLAKIESAIKETYNPNGMISYSVPWLDKAKIFENSVDFLLSQAVLEHVDDIKQTYEAMFCWMKPSGFISHQIDLKSHGLSVQWNGHWKKNDFVWKIIRGGRKYLINRLPCSEHVQQCQGAGFAIVLKSPKKKPNSIRRSRLARRFRLLSQEELETCSLFLQARKSESN